MEKILQEPEKRSRRDQHESSGCGKGLRNRGFSENRAFSEIRLLNRGFPQNRGLSCSRLKNRESSQNRRAERRITNVEALIQESKKAREDKQVIFDLSKRPKSEASMFLRRP